MKRKNLLKPVLILSLALAFNFASLLAYCSCCLEQPATVSESSSHACCKSTEKDCSQTQKCSHLNSNLATNDQANLSNSWQQKPALFYLSLATRTEMPALLTNEWSRWKFILYQQDDLISPELFQSNCAYLL